LLTGAKYTAQLLSSAPRSFRRLAVRVFRREALSLDLQVRRSWRVARHRHSPPMATEGLDFHPHQRRRRRLPGVLRLGPLLEVAVRPNNAGIAL